MKTSIVLSFFLSVVAQADIVGGVNIKPGDPVSDSTAALYEPGPGGEGSLCTASVIGPHTAVTAAHCITPGRKPVMIFGNDIRSPQRELRPVSQVAVNPKWSKHQETGMDQGDIAIVKFPGGLPPDYEPVPMLQSDQALKKGRSVTLAGYGISNAAEKSGAGILRKTRVRISNGRSGKSEMVLDQRHGHGACHGDSGGPAFIKQGRRQVLAGVTNRGYPDSAPDDCAHDVVYTKVNAYAPWIDHTEKHFEGEGAPHGDSTEADQAMRTAKGRLRRRMPIGPKAMTHLRPTTRHRLTRVRTSRPNRARKL